MAPSSDLNNAGGALSPVENTDRALQPRATPIHPVPVSHNPPALSAAPNALSLLKALRHRLRLALTVGSILAAVVAAVVWNYLPPSKITARMQLHVNPTPPRLLFQGERDPMGMGAFLRNQAYLIRDRFSFIAVLRNQEIANLPTIREQADPVQWLEKNVTVEFPSSEFIQVSVSGDHPDDLLKIVAEVTKTYLDKYVDREQNEHEARRAKLKQVHETWQQRLEKAKSDLKAEQGRVGGVTEESVILVQQLQLEEIESVKKRIAAVREKILVVSVEMGLNPDWESKVWPQYAAVLNCQPGPGLPVNHALTALLHDEYLIVAADPNAPMLNEADLEALIDQDQEIGKSMAMLKVVRGEIANRRAKLQTNQVEPKTKKLREQENALEKNIEEKRNKLRPQFMNAMRKRLLNAAKGERHTRDASLRSLKALESRLVEEFKNLTKDRKQKLNDAGALLQTLDEIDQAKKLVNKTSELLIEIDVEKDAGQRVTPSSKEPILVNVDETKRKLTITGASAAGALFVVLLAFAWFEFHSRKVYTTDEVVQDLGLQLMGTVPDHSPRGWLPWSRAVEANPEYTQSMLTESVDTARTMLLHYASREQLQIVMITSALSGEGKTSLASHLAASLARAGRRTILVDSDLRNPTLHRLFDRERTPGLAELLRGEIDLANVIGETAVANLWLIPAGKAETIALQALALDPVAKIFERLRLHYDFVIVDSCPVLPVADAMLVGQHVDAVIFSLLREVSRMPRVHAAYQRLSVLGIRMLGAVVNGIQHDRYPSDYHYLAQDPEAE